MVTSILNPVKNSYYIISAYLSHLSKEDNEARHLALQHDLSSFGVPIYSVEGSYKGSKEKAYLIPMDKGNRFLYNNISILAEDYNQESILIVSDGVARLAYTRGDTIILGSMKLVSEDRLTEVDGYFKINNLCFSAG